MSEIEHCHMYQRSCLDVYDVLVFWPFEEVVISELDSDFDDNIEDIEETKVERGSLPPPLLDLSTDEGLMIDADVEIEDRGIGEGPGPEAQAAIVPKPLKQQRKVTRKRSKLLKRERKLGVIEHLSAVATWIRIPELPIHYFHEALLRNVVKSIGSFLKADECTLTAARGKYAGIAVLLDLTERLKGMVDVDGVFYKVEYEALPLICFSCGIYGHNSETCPTFPVAKAAVTTQEKPTGTKVGDWMQAPKRVWRGPPEFTSTASDKKKLPVGVRSNTSVSNSFEALNRLNQEPTEYMRSSGLKNFEIGKEDPSASNFKWAAAGSKRKNENRDKPTWVSKKDPVKEKAQPASKAKRPESDHKAQVEENNVMVAVQDSTPPTSSNPPILNPENHTVVYIPHPGLNRPSNKEDPFDIEEGRLSELEHQEETPIAISEMAMVAKGDMDDETRDTEFDWIKRKMPLLLLRSGFGNTTYTQVEIFIPVEEAELERGIFILKVGRLDRTEQDRGNPFRLLESENQQILPLQYVLVCTDEYGRRGQAPIRDDESMSWIYRGAHLRPALYVEVADEPVQDVGEGTTGGQYDGAGSSGVGGTNEDDDDTEDDVHGNSDEEYVPSDESDDDYSDHDASSVVISIFDDISDMDKSELVEDSDGITMWDGNWQTVRHGVHFANKKEVQTAVGEWTLRQGRACRVKYSRPYTWAAECETKGPKYPEELLHGTTCLWKCRATLQKDTNTWRMVVWVESHNCLGATTRNEGRNLTSTMIARLITANVRKDPGYSVAQIQVEVNKRYRVTPNYKKAWHGRRKALESLYGTWENNFQQLPSFREALLKANPDTRMRFKFTKDTKNRKKKVCSTFLGIWGSYTFI
ncbi:OLC1v1004861C1 [Oldenlandia corymbosa var. corymbosa]|uniref:OLC1v1004861C1 n=1 Tax=Oldenlandia corymbosa var. corymbosa TaxID=529605 RepID=A0AAV1DDC5_OLDCO|nr:OLC1v1004861C1 [Oldenlandia corymbosa var. corymbosa]